MASPSDSGAATAEDTIGQEAPRQSEEARVRLADANTAEVEKKKKKKRKPRSGKKRETGFEEYYCDPPMTPAEHEEEKNVLYPAHRPFVDRIEECIQRFRARRRMDNIQNHIFTRYLLLGGVDTSQRQFQSTGKLTDEVLEGRTKAEVRDIVADDVIQRGKGDSRCYNPNSPEHWDVDFTGVAAGFFSEQLVRAVGTGNADYKVGVEVVCNFLKYVDRHDVCPEYITDVRNAQRLCGKALEEMPKVSELDNLFPGSFSKAACALFLGEVNDETFEFDDWVTDKIQKPFDEHTAKTVFGASVAILLEREDSQRISQSMAKKELVVTETAEQTFEVVGVVLPDDEARSQYEKINDHLRGDLVLEACGLMAARPTVVRDGWDNPTAGNALDGSTNGVGVFFLEESILKLLKVGMKLTLGVCSLNADFQFIKCVKNIYPTFYTFLPQELMMHYKEPTKDDHPGLSVHDLDDDNEDILAEIPVGDPEELDEV